MIRYAKPTTVDEALALLGEGAWRILAGGTDFYPAQGAKPFRDNVLDINGLAALRGIAETDDPLVIGARTTWTDIVRHPLPPAFDALKQAAREVGSVQIQNVATVAGNLCNASPAADGVPAPARARRRGRAALRQRQRATCRWQDFILGNRRTALQAGEMVTAIRVPKHAARRHVGLRQARRAALSRHLHRHGGGASGRRETASSARRPSPSAPARRSPSGLPASRPRLRGKPAGHALADAVLSAPMAELSPIDDVRGSAEYRLDAAREIVARAVLRPRPMTTTGAA